ncbi:methionyl-tRNA formyltransferase [Helicobacter sp. MIT 14-3879]|uniref:methionyl-tRNA formyltransferase n=1 Tax=Helicobacter sp. MIT 14-3879 TaxID=2040649 RepID=UPI000E1F645D|nr:methionyl-tRNA formyltransferase [Helicobacter sp. MIT 14-3879]RDU62417.1 methionyl-tRNA formyltransferase [Helicobacter sp. MIT 14-3879]
MRIIFFGTPIFAKNILQDLIQKFEIIALITQEDKPFGRKKELKMPECKEFIISNELKIPIFQPTNVKEIINNIYSLKPNLILVVAYGKMLPEEITAKFYCINIHASILPKSRGASPIQDMILQNQKYFGVSLIKMNDKLDSGEILSISYIKNNSFDIEESNKILSSIASRLAIKTINSLDSIQELKQIEADCSYCKKINKKDGIIDFNNAEEIYLKYLAYKTWPQIYITNGTKLSCIDINEKDSTNIKGKILEIHKDYIVIACKRGSIKVKYIQSVGKNKLPASAYINGKRLKVNDTLE